MKQQMPPWKKWLRDKLGITETEHQLRQQMDFLEALARLAAPEWLEPDPELQLSLSAEGKLPGREEFSAAIHRDDPLWIRCLEDTGGHSKAAFQQYFDKSRSGAQALLERLPDKGPWLEIGGPWGTYTRYWPVLRPENFSARISMPRPEPDKGLWARLAKYHTTDPGARAWQALLAIEIPVEEWTGFWKDSLASAMDRAAPGAVMILAEELVFRTEGMPALWKEVERFALSGNTVVLYRKIQDE